MIILLAVGIVIAAYLMTLVFVKGLNKRMGE
jgi:hypothetical protein